MEKEVNEMNQDEKREYAHKAISFLNSPDFDVKDVRVSGDFVQWLDSDNWYSALPGPEITVTIKFFRKSWRLNNLAIMEAMTDELRMKIYEEMKKKLEA